MEQKLSKIMKMQDFKYWKKSLKKSQSPKLFNHLQSDWRNKKSGYDIIDD